MTEAVPTARRRVQRAWLYYGIGLVAYGLLVTFLPLAPETVPTRVTAADLLLVAVCAFPTARWYTRTHPGIPIFEIICLYYGVQYALPVYLQPNLVPLYTGPIDLGWDPTVRTLLLTALGMATMIAAYICVMRSRLRSKLPPVDLQMNDRQLSAYIVFAFLFGIGTTIFNDLHVSAGNSGPLGGVIRLLSFQGIVGLALLAVRVYGSASTQRGWRYLLYVWLAILVGLGLSTGLLEGAFVPVAIVALVRWYARRKFPWRLALLGVLVFLILQPVKQEYRSAAWQGQNLPVEQRVTLWFHLGTDVINQIASGQLTPQGVATQSSGRLDLLHQFVVVDAESPDLVPYLHGQTYTYLAFSWIPRFVWPDKPFTSDASDALALRYGLLNPIEYGKTTLGLGQIAEAYANFGIFGLLLLMALQGLLFACLDLLFNRRSGQASRAVYVAQMIWFLNGIGTSTAIVLGGIVQGLVPTTVLLRFFSSRNAPHLLTEHGSRQKRASARSLPARAGGSLGRHLVSSQVPPAPPL